MSFATPSWDLSLFWHLNDVWRSDFLDFFMPLISNSILMWAIGLSVIAVALVRSNAKKRKKILVSLLLIAICAGLSDLTCGVIKDQVGRVRPVHALANAHFMEGGEWSQHPSTFVQTKERGSSFVSGHAANSMTVALIAALLFPAWRFVLLPFPFLVGWSRVYLAKHYPLDVFGGWITGILLVIVLVQIWKMLRLRYDIGWLDEE